MWLVHYYLVSCVHSFCKLDMIVPELLFTDALFRCTDRCFMALRWQIMLLGSFPARRPGQRAHVQS